MCTLCKANSLSFGVNPALGLGRDRVAIECIGVEFPTMLPPPPDRLLKPSVHGSFFFKKIIQMRPGLRLSAVDRY